MSRRAVTAEDLAVHLGTSTSAVHGWLASRRVPEPPVLLALARALRLRPADLTLIDEAQERLADLRIHAGLLQAAAAEAAGLRQPQLSKMERGVSVPKPELCQGLARAYGVPEERVLAAWKRSRRDRQRHAAARLA
ncbi:helix-turn-helix domain-containing protein [Dietzia sp. 179-F 9C3 NHS]|uniref:helix-turn-helix domain-containing protein n=1 Tax=Dietzia sp. 179-F 9C3 NHS TaxID=3374295 RepID=UPI003879C037